MTPISKQGNNKEGLIPQSNYNKQEQQSYAYCYKPYRTLKNY